MFYIKKNDAANSDPVERMRIDEGGHVKIGLDKTGDNNPTVHIAQDNSELLKLTHSGTAEYRIGIDGGQNFFIYNPSSTGVYLQNGATSWSGNSDERVKRDISEITDCLNNISNIRPVYYNFNRDEPNQKKRIGFIAQEWQEKYPEIINSSKNDKYDFDVLGLEYTSTIPILLGAIKELKARVEALENA